MSFSALAIAAAAAVEVSRYTGLHPAFLESLDVSVSHTGRNGRPVFTVRGTAYLLGYLETAADGSPVGVHDLLGVRLEADEILEVPDAVADELLRRRPAL